MEVEKKKWNDYMWYQSNRSVWLLQWKTVWVGRIFLHLTEFTKFIYDNDKIFIDLRYYNIIDTSDVMAQYEVDMVLGVMEGPRVVLVSV